MAVPQEYQLIHSASSRRLRTNSSNGNGSDGVFYCWESFGGQLCYVAVDCEEPTVYLYVKGSLKSWQTPTKTEVEGASVYKAVFSGLQKDDIYYIESKSGEITKTTNKRTYIGGEGSSPTLSITDTEIKTSMSSPYNKSYSMALGVITFDRDYGSLSNYSREARTLFWESCLQTTEYHAILGKVGNEGSIQLDQNGVNGEWVYPDCFTHEARIFRFGSVAKANGGVKVGFASSSKTSAYYSEFSEYVNDWITDVNKLTGDVLFYRDDSIGEDDLGIRITLGSHEELWGYTPENYTTEVEVNYGRLYLTLLYPDISESYHYEVKLCNELREAMDSKEALKNIVYEELTECLGCSNDTFRVYDSLFSEIWYKGKTNTLIGSDGNATTDGQVVQLLYNEVNPGDLATELVHKLTPSAACVVQLPCGRYGNKSGCNYTVTPYAMNREVTWEKDGDNTYWDWDSSNNCYSDLGTPITVIPDEDTLCKAVAVYNRGVNWFQFNMGESSRTYDIKLVSGSTEISITNVGADDDCLYYTGEILSPTTSYQVYSRFSGTSNWFGGFTATTNPLSPQFSVSQKDGAFSVTVSPPSEGTYTYVYITVQYTYNGNDKIEYEEKAICGQTYTYQADEGTSYEVSVHSVYVVDNTRLTSEEVYTWGTIASVRPNNWEWSTSISTSAYIPFSDNAFHPVTASEWNNFTARINEFRKYKGLSEYTFTTVAKGDTFTAKIYNEAVYAIQGIDGYGTYLTFAVKGETNALSASAYTSLRDELNAIP